MTTLPIPAVTDPLAAEQAYWQQQQGLQDAGGGSADYSSSSHSRGGFYQQDSKGNWYYVNGAGKPNTAITDVSVQKGVDGNYYYVSKSAGPLGVAPTPKATKTPINFGSLSSSSGPTWYEKQQIALDKQRIKDAEAAQAAQLAYQHQQQLIAQSNAVEAANQSFRDAQLKSTYGTINGMAYGSPKGAPVSQLLPEPLLLKQAYAAGKQPDPWNQAAPYGGYTGSQYMNAQQPGLSAQGDPNQAVPKTGPGSPIPLPTDTSTAVPGMAGGGSVPGSIGQPQLIVAHGGEEITPAPGTPMPTLLGSPGGKPFSNPLDPSDPNNPSPTNGPDGPSDGSSINDAISNLIAAAQALVTHPGFKGVAPIPGTPPISGSDSSQPPIPGMAAGGMVGYPVMHSNMNAGEGDETSIPGYASGGRIPYANASYSRSAALQSTPVTTSSRWPVHQSTLPLTTGSRGPSGIPLWMPMGQNAYGQASGNNVVHSPFANDINAGPGVLNHMPYSPVLTGLSGYGATMTPDGTPVIMSNWQRSHLMDSSISGPGGYDDYAMQVAGWSPTDLKGLGNSVTGNFATDLTAPKNYTPISVNPAPAGG